MTATTIATDRLVLRPLTMADYAAYGEFMASARSVHMGGPFDSFASWGLFCHDVALWSLVGHGGLMIEVLATGETVGSVSINAGPLFPEAELGWFLYSGHEGRGYATEAARALREWGFGTRGLTTLVSYVDPANGASVAVAERLGAQRDASAPRQKGDEADLVFRHPAPGVPA